MSSKPNIKELQNALYQCCSEEDSERLFYQADLMGMGVIPGNDARLLMSCAQALVNEGLLKILTHQDTVVWKVVKKEDANKYKTLTQDESLIFSYIEASGREGIWTKTLKTRTNLHQTVQTRCLRSLENRSLVKSIKSVKWPSRKIYMLASLTPSEDVTGGPWFTDSELDSDFIEALLGAIERFVLSRSFARRASQASAKSAREKGKGRMMASEATIMRDMAFAQPAPATKRGPLPFPPGYRGYPTAKDITAWVSSAGITDTALSEGDIRQLMDVLCYDGRAEKVLDGTAYKAVRPPDGGADEIGAGNGLTEAPCGRCPVFGLCEEGGPVSASNCEYFKVWLDI
ncbi:MAG: 34-kDa subunit of RNA polymerase III (C) [Trizodia sp. TS-e1964]|nr:MAG: 34-kDa subunit of RNA polymerase III (C) [Trizodia sp. TS-e1964]